MARMFVFAICFGIARTAFAEPSFCKAQASLAQIREQVITPQWRLAWGLHQKLAPSFPNLAVSPVSIHETLSLAAAGARGKTLSQFDQILGGNLTQPVWSNAVAAFKAELVCGKNTETSRILLASNVFTQAGSALNPEWLSAIARAYDAQPSKVDFLHEHQQSIQTINDWAEAQTEGHIINLLDPSMVPRSTKLVLANAVFLKAPWKKPFDPKRTKRAKFAGRYDVDMMRTVGTGREFAYAQASRFETIIAPTKDQQYAVAFFLPASQYSLAELEKSLTADDLERAMRAAKPEVVDFSLPRFALMPALELKKPLSDLGLDQAFAPGRADFSGINNVGGISIEVFAHKALVKFNEAGFEAAAVSAAVMAPRSAAPQRRPIVVIIDRPFLFAIVHHATGAPLFLGRVSEF